MRIESEQQYRQLRARCDRNNAWVNSKRSPSNGWAAYKPEEVPLDCRVTNEERSAVEVWEFCHNPPADYFLYVSEDKRLATTWTGDLLGKVNFGREYRSPAFGRCSVRVPITVQAVNGFTYYGTYYKSSGNYARVKMSKARK